MVYGLKVPYAIDRETGLVVHARNAFSTKKYLCLDCGQSLSPRSGPIRQKHFFHPPTSRKGCSGESTIHKAAKTLLAQQLKRELVDCGKIFIERKCGGLQKACANGSFVKETINVENWTDVLVEVAVEAFRLDVAIVNESDVVFGFEVFHRHAVPSEKAAELGIPWVELVAEEILAFKPRNPFPHEYSTELCYDCIDLLASLKSREPEDRERMAVTVIYQNELKRINESWQTVLLEAKKLSAINDTRLTFNGTVSNDL